MLLFVISMGSPEVKKQNVVGYMWVKKMWWVACPGGLCKFNYLRDPE
jgi:hypothetical protein